MQQRDAAMQRCTLDFPLTLKAAGDDGVIEGYGSVFGVMDAYADIVAAGAFAESLKAHKAAGTMPAMLWQHDSDEPVGVWTEMVEDDKGLLVRGRLAMGTTRGREASELLKMRAINGLSIGFYSRQWSYDAETDVRTLTAVDLWEVSLVTFPANREARVQSVKSIDDLATLKDCERLLRDAGGFSRSEATALVSRIKALGGRSDSDGGQQAAELMQALARRNVFTVNN
jgi:HK97 family phage prohead protease